MGILSYLIIIYYENESESHSVISDSLQPQGLVHGILQARILEWVAFLFSRGLPNPGIKPRSPTLQADSLPAEPPGNRLRCVCVCVVGGINLTKFKQTILSS